MINSINSYNDFHKNFRNHHLIIKPVFFGTLAGLALLFVYFLVLTIANSFGHALDQFVQMWYWIALLVVGFGIQVGLYFYIRGIFKLKSMSGTATTSVAATGGVSATSMVACCAHHLADVLPFIGLSAAAIFLNKYQLLFIIVGVLSNLIGINMMLGIIQKHRLFAEHSIIMKYFMRLNMKKTLFYNASFGVIVFLLTLVKLI